MPNLLIKELTPKEKDSYNKAVTHPMQSWDWGEFKKKTNIIIVRQGAYKGGSLIDGFQLSIHKIPFTPWTLGYLPKGKFPDKNILSHLTNIGRKYKCIFIKLEPNKKKSEVRSKKLKIGSNKYNLVRSAHPIFTKYTFQLDLTKSEEELRKNMKSKTRYNVRLAQKKGVKIIEDNSQEAFEEYLSLTRETNKRQKFYSHNEKYHREMWDILRPAGIAHLFKAVYRGKTLVTWIVFLFNGVTYYPYGASSNKHRDVMASNLMMWKVILWGKEKKAKLFDMWGALSPEQDKNNSWYGFHKFKEGYGGELVELIGSYDLVLNPLLYRLYTLSHNIRWLILRARK